MLAAVVDLTEGDEFEMAILSGQVYFVTNLDHFLGAQAIGNQVLDGNDGHIVFFSHFYQLWQSRHRSVRINNLDECCSRVETSDTHQVNRGFGVTSTFQYAFVHSSQGVNMAWTAKVLRLAMGISQGADSHGAVMH